MSFAKITIGRETRAITRAKEAAITRQIDDVQARLKRDHGI